MENNEVSRKYTRLAKPSWEKEGFEVVLYEGCTPETFNHYMNPQYRLTFAHMLASKRKRVMSPTEKAIWYSHYKLWLHSIFFNEPLIVAEHDAILIKPFVNNYFTDLKHQIVCLCHGDTESELAPYWCWCKDCTSIKNRRRRTVGGAYYITPQASMHLVNLARGRKIDYNSDGHIDKIMKFFNTIYYTPKDHIHSCQYKNFGWGTTIDHGQGWVK